MKKERRIIIKNPVLKKIRNFLRELLITIIEFEVKKNSFILNDILESDDPYLTSNVKLINHFINRNNRLINLSLNSICNCRFCCSIENDMLYTLENSWGWLCIPCYDKFKKIVNYHKDYNITLEH